MVHNFLRMTAVQIGTLYTDKLDIEFEISCESEDDASATTATIRIYNLTAETRERIEIDSLVKVWAGYAEDYGLIYLGRVKESATIRDGADTMTEISCVDYSWPATMRSKTYNKGTPINDILQQLFADAALPAGEIVNDMGVTTNDTYTTSTNGKTTLDELIAMINGDPDTIAQGVSVHYAIIGGVACVVSDGQTTSDAHVLQSSTGLISTSASSSENYDQDATIILNWRIAKDAAVYLNSFSKTGYYRVAGYKHSADRNTYETQLMLKSLEGAA